MKFSELTAVARRDTDTFDVDIDPSAFIVRGPNGGYLAALLLRALVARVDDATRAPRSLTVHYPAAPTAGPATITTEVIRAGRSLVTASARLEQGGKPMAVALAAFSPPWSGPTWADLTPPSVPAVDHVAPRDDEVTLPFLDYWDQRFTTGDPARPQRPADAAETGGWIRLHDPEPIDAIGMAAMADAWIPAAFTRLPARNPVPTVDLTVHFRAALPHPSAPPDEHVLVRFRNQTSAEGFWEEDGALWAPDGTLLAQSRQLAIMMPPMPPS
jgi:acyl-CoA thioesterase